MTTMINIEFFLFWTQIILLSLSLSLWMLLFVFFRPASFFLFFFCSFFVVSLYFLYARLALAVFTLMFLFFSLSLSAGFSCLTMTSLVFFFSLCALVSFGGIKNCREKDSRCRFIYSSTVRRKQAQTWCQADILLTRSPSTDYVHGTSTNSIVWCR